MTWLMNRWSALLITLLLSAATGIGQPSGLPPRGLLVSKDLQTGYVEIFEYVASQPVNALVTQYQLTGGLIRQVPKAAQVDEVRYPRSGTSPAPAAELAKDLHQLEGLAQRYPQYASILASATTRLRQIPIQAAPSSTSVEPAPGTIPALVLRNGMRYQDVKILHTDSDRFAISHRNGVTEVLFSELPTDPNSLPPEVRALQKAFQANVLLQEAERKKVATVQSAALQSSTGAAQIEQHRSSAVDANPSATSGQLTPSSQPLNPETPLDKILMNVLAGHQKKLPEDIQGFRFGSSVEDVATNYFQQYGQAMDSKSVGNEQLTVIQAAYNGPATRWGDRMMQDRWVMQFGFWQGRLVFISKDYLSSVDPEATSHFMMDYFHDDGSNNDDLLGRPGMVQGKDYAGYIGDSFFALFETTFLKRELRQDLSVPFDKFCQVVKETDFLASPHLGGGFHVNFDGLISRASDFIELKPRETSFIASPFQYALRWKDNVVMGIAQTLFPPKGEVQHMIEQGAFENMSTSTYNWEADNGFFVNFRNGEIAVGHRREVPRPKKL